MVEIRWTEEASQWLYDIYAYIALDNPRIAREIIDSIYLKAQVLRKLPQIGYRHEALPKDHVRILLFGHYRIAYLIRLDGNIDILGVFHGSLDIEKYLLKG